MDVNSGKLKIYYPTEDRERAKKNRDAYKPFLLDYMESTLKHSPKGHSKYQFICPFCNSGEGKNKTGAFSFDVKNNRYCCFACKTRGDIYDLMQKVDPMQAPDVIGAFLLAERLYKGKELATGQTQGNRPTPQENGQGNAQEATETAWQREFTIYSSCPAWQSKEGRAYLSGRGFTEETIQRANLLHNTDNGRNIIIIPYEGDTDYFYNSRDIRPEASIRYYKHGKQTALYNQKALYTHGKGFVFVTEGELDALSIIEAGGQAIATGSASNADFLIKVLEGHPTEKHLILCFDTDQAGNSAISKATAGLSAQGISFSIFDIGKPYKDANALLASDGGQERLKEQIHKAIEQAQQPQTTPIQNTDTQQSNTADIHTPITQHEHTTTDPYKDRVANYLPQYIKEIKEGGKLREPVPTGFKPLDNALSGGLFTGFYIVGADSNIGKTTLLLQMADNIASSGRDIAYYSFEQSRDELITKSISRIVFEQQIAKLSNIKDKEERAKAFNLTPLEILKGNTEGHQTELEKAIAFYRDRISQNLYLSDTLLSAEEIEKRTDDHAKENAKQGKKPPVVIIDYFQILPYGQGETGEIRQHLDRAIATLRRITKNHNTTVIIISSTNRPNYNKDAGLSALKETSALEYGADIVAMLSYAASLSGGLTEKKKREEREKNCISIALKLIKGRLIKANTPVAFNFYPKAGYFESELSGQSTMQRSFLAGNDNEED